MRGTTLKSDSSTHYYYLLGEKELIQQLVVTMFGFVVNLNLLAVIVFARLFRTK